jgi:hypothetical protein
VHSEERAGSTFTLTLPIAQGLRGRPDAFAEAPASKQGEVST